MLGVGGSELIILGLMFLIIFGPSKLPQMARDIGKFVGEARRSIDEFKDELTADIDPEEKPARKRESRNGSGSSKRIKDKEAKKSESSDAEAKSTATETEDPDAENPQHDEESNDDGDEREKEEEPRLRDL